MCQRHRRRDQRDGRRHRVDRTARGRAGLQAGYRVGRAAGDDRLDQPDTDGAQGPAGHSGRLRREVGERDPAEALRDVRQHPSGPRTARRRDALYRAGHRSGGRARKRGGPLRRHRAHADARRGPVPQAHQRQGQREDRATGLRVRPVRGARIGRLCDQVEHHEAHRGRAEADLRADRAGVPRHPVVARDHRQLRASARQEAGAVRRDRDDEHER